LAVLDDTPSLTFRLTGMRSLPCGLHVENARVTLLAERCFVAFGLWLWRSYALSRWLNFKAILWHSLIAQRLGQVVLKFWAKIWRDS